MKKVIGIAIVLYLSLFFYLYPFAAVDEWDGVALTNLSYWNDVAISNISYFNEQEMF